MFKFPYTSFSQINLDWVLDKIKELEAAVENISHKWIYVGEINLNRSQLLSGYYIAKDRIPNELLLTFQFDGTTNYPITNINIPASMLYDSSLTTYNASGALNTRNKNLKYSITRNSYVINITLFTIVENEIEYLGIAAQITGADANDKTSIDIFRR